MNNQAAIQITNRCNYTCSHCLRLQITANDMSVEDFRSNLASAIQHGADSVALTGGEIILHEDLEKILGATAELRVPYGFVTNGSRVSHYMDLVKAYPNCNAVAVSIDGSTRETCDNVRCSGSYDNAVRAIREYQESYGNVSMYFLCCKKNYEDVANVVHLAKSLGVSTVWVNGVVHDGSAEGQLTVAEREFAASRAVNAGRQDGVRIRFASCFLPMRRLPCCSYMRDPQISINPLSELTFCCNTIGRGAVIADLKSSSFDDAIKSLQAQAASLQRARRYYQGDTEISTCVFCQMYFKDKLHLYKEPPC